MRLRRFATAVPLAAMLLAGTPVRARHSASHDDGAVICAGVTAGTLGIGPDVGVRLTDHIGVRASATFLGAGADFDSDDNRYRGDLRLKSCSAMIGVHPFGGSFRVSGGARINRNRVDVTLTRGASMLVGIGDTTYTAADIGVLSGGADVRTFSPALTLGWGGSRRQGFVPATEAGVLVQGGARLSDLRAAGTAQNDSGFRGALERDRRDLQSDIDEVKVYPIAQIGLGRRI